MYVKATEQFYNSKDHTKHYLDFTLQNYKYDNN